MVGVNHSPVWGVGGNRWYYTVMFEQTMGGGFRIGVELFCQEFMPVMTPLVCKYSENIKISRGIWSFRNFGFGIQDGREIGDAGGICSNKKDCEKVTGAEVIPSLLITGRTKYGGGVCACLGVIYFDFGHLHDVGTNYLQNLRVPSNKWKRNEEPTLFMKEKRKERGQRSELCSSWGDFRVFCLSSIKIFTTNRGGGGFSITELVVTPKISCKECNGMC